MKPRDAFNNAERREIFSANLGDLLAAVLRKGKRDAAGEIGVDYNWLRKMCSAGLTRVDPRNIDKLSAVAGYFRLPVEELWMPALVYHIWGGSYLPEVRKYFVEQFDWDRTAGLSPTFQQHFADMRDGGFIYDESEEWGGEEGGGGAVGGGAAEPTLEKLQFLLANGHDYLVPLIDSLYDSAKGR